MTVESRKILDGQKHRSSAVSTRQWRLNAILPRSHCAYSVNTAYEFLYALEFQLVPSGYGPIRAMLHSGNIFRLCIRKAGAVAAASIAFRSTGIRAVNRGVDYFETTIYLLLLCVLLELTLYKFSLSQKL
jgi:hypothetical protein